jgi:hypothetical protein
MEVERLNVGINFPERESHASRNKTVGSRDFDEKC